MGAGSLVLVELHEAGSDVVGFIQRKDKYSPIADLSSLSGLDDEFNDIVDFIIVCDDIDHHFGQQWLLIFHAAIDDRVSLLTSESFNIQDGHPVGDGLKRRDYIIKHVWLDNAFDQLHKRPDVERRAGFRSWLIS